MWDGIEGSIGLILVIDTLFAGFVVVLVYLLCLDVFCSVLLLVLVELQLTDVDLPQSFSQLAERFADLEITEFYDLVFGDGEMGFSVEIRKGFPEAVVMLLQNTLSFLFLFMNALQLFL